MNDAKALVSTRVAERSRLDGLRAEPDRHFSRGAVLRRAVAILGIWAAYLVGTYLGVVIYSPGTAIAFVWPAAGVLIGGLAVVAPRDRALLLGGVCLIAFLAAIDSGKSALPAGAFALANVLEGAIFIAIYTARKWPLQLGRPRQVCRFIGAAVIASGLSSVFTNLTAAENGGLFTVEFSAWSRWFVARFIGIMAIAPCFLTLNMSSVHRKIDAEALLAIACGVMLSAIIFFTRSGASSQSLLPVSLIFPFLFWCGARCSPLANAILSAAIALIIMYAIGHGLGPFSSLGWPSSRQIFASQNFVLVVGSGSLLLSILFAERRDREAQLASALEVQKALLYEVNHRVKNSLQLVSSILVIETTKLQDPEARAALQTARARIDIIAAIHRRLYSNERHAIVELGEVLEETAQSVLRSAGRDDIALVASIQPGLLADVAIAAPISLALAEIITNSVKHAYRENGGEIHLELERVGACLRLKVRDDGSGFPKRSLDPANDGIGMRIIRDLFKQLAAVIETESGDAGVTYVIAIPYERQMAG